MEKKSNEYFNLYLELETKNEELIIENNDFINSNGFDNSNMNNKIKILNNTNTQLKRDYIKIKYYINNQKERELKNLNDKVIRLQNEIDNNRKSKNI